MEIAADALIRFARLLATAPSSEEIAPLLCETVGPMTGAAAAVLVQVGDDGRPRVAGEHGFPAARALALDDVEDTAARLVAGSAARFSSSVPVPLVADGGLYGLLVLLYGQEGAPEGEQGLALAGALADLTAATLARAREIDEIERAYAQLSESKKALGQAEKLRAVGGMAAGIVHDLKNVFTPLLLQLDLLSDGAHSLEDMREMCSELKRPLQNGLAIVERLRSFSRFGRDEVAELADLANIVDDAVALCRPRAAALKVRIAIETAVAPDTPLVRVEVVEVVAALTNLIINAVDALAGTGGTIRVSVAKSGDGGASVEVIDDGPGMPEDVRARIFEPFFTTKGKAGTGLGLPMVKEMAQHHGGRLTVDSQPGEGTRFTLWLPAAVPA